MKRFLFCLLILFACSCSKFEESDIPYAQVYLEIDLRFGDNDLVGMYHHKSITKARTAGERTGFSGVLVVCGIDNYGNATYYAFDLCCPHEAKKNIIIEADNAGKAICPECGTEYDIGYGTGAPTKGVSQYPLRKILYGSNIVRQTGMGCEKLKKCRTKHFLFQIFAETKISSTFALANKNNATMRK